jgi:Arm DNA-binding domain/Phage integrase, N-terminal SAM-like domain
MSSTRRRPSRPRPITQTTIDELRPRPGVQFVCWDRTLPGFGVRVNPQGTKTYVLKYRLHTGRVRWKTIGRFGAMPLEKARRQAQTDIGIVASGKDPLVVKDAARDAPTLVTVADRFLEEHVEARRKAATLRLYRLVVDNHLKPRLGPVPIADVTADDILKLHHRLRATPYMANRVLAVTSKLINWAATAGFRGPGPHVNPCDGIVKYRERPRKRYLSPQEMTRVGCALRVAERRQAMTPGAVTATRLLLLTGARVSEILSLRWRDVDLIGGALHLPDSKTGEKTIVLSAPAVET